MNIEWLSFWLGASALLATECALLVLSVILLSHQARKDAQRMDRRAYEEHMRSQGATYDAKWGVYWPKPKPPTKETRN